MGNFIGPEPVRSYAPLAVKDDFSGDGSTTTFDLSRDITPAGQNSLLLFVGTTIQEPGVDFTIGNDGSGNPRRITFASAPASGTNNIFAIHRDRETGRFTPDDNTVGNGQLESTAVTGFSNVTAASGDSLLISDVSDSGNLKKVLASSLVALASTDLSNDTSPQLGGDLDVNSNDIVSTSNANISLLPNGTGKVVIDGNGSSGGVSIDDGNIDIRTATGAVSKIKFYCESSNAHAQTLQAQPHSAASSAVLTLPVATGTLVGTGDTGSVSNTMLAGSIAASKLAGSIGNAKLSNSSISVSDGSSSTATALGGTITFSGTSNEVDVAESSGTITIGLPNDITIAGNLTVNGTTTTVNSTNTTLDDNLLELNSGATSNANDSGIIIERGSTGNNAIFVWDESADSFIVGTTTATASDTGNLSITAAPFAASTISATELDMGDSEKIKLGASNDLEIYHDSNHSYIEDTGTGDLKLKASIVEIQNTDATVGAKFTGDGSVELNHDGTKKFETTSAGVTITGTATATTFSGSGASLTSLPAANLTGTISAISGANLTNLPAANLTGTLPAISGANLTSLPVVVPSDEDGIGAIKEFALYYKGSGTPSTGMTISIGATVTPSTYDTNSMYLGVPEVIDINFPSSGGSLSQIGRMRGFRATGDPVSKTRGPSGTWRCLAQASYVEGSSSGGSGITYHLSLAGLFQRIA